jgi:hypothetical protein
MPLSNDQNAAVDISILALMCSVLTCQQDWACTAENFAVVHWQFKVGRDDATIHVSGRLSPMKSIVSSGFKHHWDVAPAHVRLPSRPSEIDGALLSSLAAFLRSGADQPDRMRLVEGIRWLRFACSNDDSFADGARILAMTTAFECMLPKFENRAEFATAVDDLSSSSNQPRRRIGGTVQLRKFISLELTEIGWWAYDFYSLRGNIVHGGRVNSADYYAGPGAAHFTVSVAVFLECLKSLLERSRLYQRTTLDRTRLDRALAGHSGTR